MPIISMWNRLLVRRTSFSPKVDWEISTPALPLLLNYGEPLNRVDPHLAYRPRVAVADPSLTAGPVNWQGAQPHGAVPPTPFNAIRVIGAETLAHLSGCYLEI